MGLTTAMYTGLTGLNVNQTRINTIGNNIANVNTTAFRSSRTLFQSHFSQLLSAGNGPSASSGGVNPTQVGLGAVVAATQMNFTPGSIETTGIASDLALEGAGLFVVRRVDGGQFYTRDGSFSLDSNSQLVTVDGHLVQGFGVDEEFNIIANNLTDLTLPLGTLSVARATENVFMDGDLSAQGSIATQGSRLVSQGLLNGGGGVAGAGTSLTNLRSPSAPGVRMYAAGDTITVSGATKGGRSIPTGTFTVGTDGSTLGDYAAWLENTLGINTEAGVPGQPGVTIENGAIVINSNAGVENEIEISANDILSSSTATPGAFDFTKTQDANGSSVFTSYTIYDSLGNPVIARVTFALEETPNTGPVWRYYVESQDNSGASSVVGTGTVTFDNNGNFVSVDGNEFTISRDATGAGTPLTFTLQLEDVHGLSTKISNVIMADQDGFPPGTLSSFTVGGDGTINGTFTNGLSRPLGQVAVAMFANPEGLVAESDNLFGQGPNSGPAAIVPPGTFGAGSVLAGALELSNVDLAREFIGLITSSTGFQASSRVISTSNDMLDQLLLILR